MITNIIQDTPKFLHDFIELPKEQVTFVSVRFTCPQTEFGHTFLFLTFVKIGSTDVSYLFTFRQSIALVQTKQTALRSTVMSINRKNQEDFAE
jgi:hypothetical protein